MRKMTIARLRGVSAVAIAMVLATGAKAQTVDESANSDDDIIVTAQKREERLQKVPISISVLSGQKLDSQANGGVSDALRDVAGVSITNSPQGGGTQLTIRGVSAYAATLAGSSTTAFYVDSVPFGLVKSAILPDTNAFDMQRIEVLRGPQGTLYGANALNGVVRLLTNDANLSAIEVKGRAGIASTRGGDLSYRADAAVNVPLIDGKLAVRVVAGFENAGGWIEQPNRGLKNVNEQDSRNFRVKLNAQPTDRLSIGLSAWISRLKQDAPNYASAANTQLTTVPLPQEINYDAYSGRVEYDFDGFTVSSATSYLKFDNTSQRDYTTVAPNLRLFTNIKSKIFTEELLLNSTTSGSLRWSAGFFYRDAVDLLYQTLPGLLPAPINTNDKSRSYAVFGQLTQSFLDGKLELTGGLRYFHDRVSQVELTPQSGNPAQVLANKTTNFSAVTPRVVLTWLPSSQFTAYASYSQGFRSGFNQSPSIIRTAPQIPPAEADRLHNYEIGAKGSIANGLITFDAAAFYIDWTRIQQNLNLIFNGVVYAATVNGKGASGFGTDLALVLHPTPGLDIGGTLSINGLKFDAPLITQTAAGPVTLFNKGDRPAFSPSTTASAFVDYKFPLNDSGLKGLFSTSLNYRSKVPISVLISGVPRFFISDAPLTLRASAGLTSSKWTASVYVDNLTNWKGLAQPPYDVSQQYRLRPTTIGAQIEFKF